MQESSVVAGIDWAAELHAVCVLGADGTVIERFDVTHASPALHVMVSKFRKAGVTKVASERGDGPVVQVSIDAGFAVFVVPSRAYCRRGRRSSATACQYVSIDYLFTLSVVAM